ncbi:hypothetical protein BC831DRAFT_461655 [Entophlyctis helioformis]|nr:hypothetical protein BC831DRAFT_461655 [Entophlyctis helioformis]
MADAPPAVTDALGIAGGILLSICAIPQLVVMWQNRSARDVSLLWISAYTGGLVLTLAYLTLLRAWAGAIPLVVETALGLAVLLSKVVLDRGWFGPSPRPAPAHDLTGVAVHS